MKPEEVRVQQLFSELFALDLRKIPERSVPTPDFDVYTNQEQIAVLELKALKNTAEVIGPEELSEDEDPTRLLANDNGAGRIAKRIQDAVLQLADTKHPRIVAFLNEAVDLDRFDLQEALLGYLAYGDEKVTTMTAGTLKRMTVDRSKVDLYIWIDTDSTSTPSFVATGPVGADLRARHFDPHLAGAAG